ncbi:MULTISPECIES: flagellar protein FlhE [unclassified Halomonas]|uniref:flagellar protein FlhE n=1 Tax=unclassified Halomonas TaxID=2609666 RepID=UPI000696F03F|nr:MULTISPECIES: flagellar protein FlhE [unclassified Halomonas]MCO7217956.1 flagellar protein FlhE [Halomonas sp. OfavH-34-E]RQW70365.1 flagellar FlhE [Halomonas sp. YLB-10]
MLPALILARRTQCAPRRLAALSLLALWLIASGAQGFPGAWTANAPRMTVASSQLDQSSRPLTPPSASVEGVIERVVWRYRTAPGARLQGRLCHGQRCLRLKAAHGSTEHFAGLDAAGPFVFRFRLLDGESPLVVDGMSVIVNHR